VRTSTNAPVAGAVVTFQNVNDSFDTRRAITNSQGKAIAGAYAKLAPPESEQWIATAVVDGMECSSRPVNIQVIELNTPAITADSRIYVNPFSSGGMLPAYAWLDAFWPAYSFYDPSYGGFVTGESFEYNGWTYTPGFFPWAASASYYPYWGSTYSYDSRPFFAVAATSPFPIWY
jgi:hypothetical protein